jgi:vacuolar-type H+-ATPase subunit F/Vma7
VPLRFYADVHIPRAIVLGHRLRGVDVLAAQDAQSSSFDLDTARAMLESKRYLGVLFCCRQAVEKMLKAIIAKRSQELPP